MRIALIAPPFIAVPPKAYGGTELFIAQLAGGLVARGHDVIVYANGDSTVDCEVRWIYRHSQWPPSGSGDDMLRHLHHTAWALRDAEDSLVDVVHINDATAVPMTRFLQTPAVHTLHHPHDARLSSLYAQHAELSYIAISDHQRQAHRLPRLRTIHHGVRMDGYTFRERKEGYLAFLGRIAPMKGAHVAVQIARKSGVPLKLAGEIQPMFRSYWEQEVEPFVDGHLVEYVGEATHDMKNDLLSRASALLFPISWEEPFGLVMIEAMACGTPVLAFPGGAVAEIVQPGVSGWICHDVDELAARAVEPGIAPAACREYVRRRFSVERMVERYERAYADVAPGLRTAEVGADLAGGTSPSPVKA